MTVLTRWVFAHRRLVVALWIVLIVAGIATAGAATKAMDQKSSVPGKEGWETSLKIAETFRGTGGNVAPLVPVIALPAGTAVTDPGVDEELSRVEQRGGEEHERTAMVLVQGPGFLLDLPDTVGRLRMAT